MSHLYIGEFANILGMVGVIFVLYAYFALQINKMSPDSIIFSMLNTLGSGFILISLYYYWNLASGVIEIAWLFISFFGLVKSIRLKLRNNI